MAINPVISKIKKLSLNSKIGAFSYSFIQRGFSDLP